MDQKTQLQKLATRLPDRFIGDNGRGHDACDHTVITQLLLLHVGPYSFEIVRELYGGTKKKAEGDAPLTGVIGRLTCEIDGRTVTIEEAGGLENAANPDGNGEKAKHAASDALKRCAMRTGLGLHIWSQGMYFLDKSLSGGEQESRQKSAPANNRREKDTEAFVYATGHQKSRITTLAEDLFPDGIADLEAKRKPINTLSEEDADAWIKGLEEMRHGRMEKARGEIDGMRGAAK